MRRWRPSAAHTLLLHAAFDRTPAKVASAWSQWLAGGNDILTTDHVSLRLMPVIGKNLARHAVPEAALDRLRGVRRHSFVEHTRYARQLAPVIQSLAAEGVAVVLLGGLVLAQRFYGEVGLRAPSDTALLVAPRDVPAAVRCLRRLGFGPQGQHPATLLAPCTARRTLPIRATRTRCAGVAPMRSRCSGRSYHRRSDRAATCPSSHARPPSRPASSSSAR